MLYFCGVLQQEEKDLMKKIKLHLQYFGTYQFQNKLWFSNGGFNGLFSIDLSDYSLEFRKMISYLDKKIQWPDYGNIHCTYENKLFLFPFNCNQIMIHDFQCNDIQELPITPMNNSNIYMTAGIFQINNRVWIFPGDMSAGLWILDLKRLHLERDIQLAAVLKDVRYIYNYENVIQVSEEEVAILSGMDTIVQINILKKQIVYSRYFGEDIHIWSIKYDGKNFWLLLYESTFVYEWKTESDELVKYELLEQDTEWIDIPGPPYINMVFFDNKLILLPSRLKSLMRIDKETNTIRKVVDYPEGFKFLKNQFGIERYPAFGAFDIVDNKLILHPLLGNMMLIYNVEENHIEGIEFIVTQDEVPYLNEIILKQTYQETDIYVEKDDFGGVEMLWLMANNKNSEYRKNGKRYGIGEEIHHIICEVN